MMPVKTIKDYVGFSYYSNIKKKLNLTKSQTIPYVTYDNGIPCYEVNLYLTGGNDTDFPMYGTKQAGKDDIAFTLASVKDQETTNKAKATEQ